MSGRSAARGRGAPNADYFSTLDTDPLGPCPAFLDTDYDDWALAIWQASSDSYAGSVLLNGHFTGHPNLALDTACTLYLADTRNHTP
jgi:hypothetical protein